jgi:hypothetical protein
MYRLQRTDKVKLSLCLMKIYAMKTYGGVDVWIHIFFTPGEKAPRTQWIGGWVVPNTGMV